MADSRRRRLTPSWRRNRPGIGAAALALLVIFSGAALLYALIQALDSPNPDAEYWPGYSQLPPTPRALVGEGR